MISPMSSPYHTVPAHPGSPASSANHPNLQPGTPQSCNRPTFQLLHAAAVEVLQRVEAQSAVDIESYVRALGDKRYAAVKEKRRADLLRRARAEKGVTDLDDATVRRHTNLASAEASRAKKEFILEELHSQLKRKSEDAIVLARELRRVLFLVEDLSATNQRLDFQLHHQRFSLDPFSTAQAHVQGQVIANQETTSRFGITEARKCELAPTSEEQFFSAVSHERDDDQHVTEYSSIMDQGGSGQDTAATTTVTTANSNAESLRTDTPQGIMTGFEVDENLKMEALICPSNVGSAYEVDDAKINVLQRSLPSLQTEIAESLALSVSNPSNHFAIAG